MTRYLSAEDIAETLRSEGDVAISGRTVHYYAEQRLLPPPDYHGSRPRYTDVHLAAMRRVRELKGRGYTLEAIGAMVGTPEAAAASPTVAAPAPVQPVLRQPAAPAQPVPSPPSAQPTSSHTRTLVVAPGLTLSASGWDDATLDTIVRAIRATIDIKTGERS